MFQNAYKSGFMNNFTDEINIDQDGGILKDLPTQNPLLPLFLRKAS